MRGVAKSARNTNTPFTNNYVVIGLSLHYVFPQFLYIFAPLAYYHNDLEKFSLFMNSAFHHWLDCIQVAQWFGTNFDKNVNWYHDELSD